MLHLFFISYLLFFLFSYFARPCAVQILKFHFFKIFSNDYLRLLVLSEIGYFLSLCVLLFSCVHAICRAGLTLGCTLKHNRYRLETCPDDPQVVNSFRDIACFSASFMLSFLFCSKGSILFRSFYEDSVSLSVLIVVAIIFW